MKNESEKPVALVFRKRMLPYSETFVAAQGIHLPRWRPVFAGATEDRSGLHLLEGSGTCILTECVACWQRPAASFLFKRFGKIPGSWLRALRALRPSLLHVHFGPDALFMGLPLSKALRIPLVVTFHGFDITIDAPDSRYQKQRHRLFREAARVIAVSDYIKGQLIQHGCPPEKIVRHYIGIDLERFTPLEGTFTREGVVFVGRLTEKKGCRHLIEAMLLMKEEGKPHRLDVIGDGGLRQELEELAKPLGESVVFHGRQGPDFVRDKVGKAAVFCAPSVTSRSGDSEGLGMVNLEAMALGTPVVSTFHTAIPEAVSHEETGILVPEGDSRALAVALARCLEDGELASRLGSNGIARVRDVFDVRKQCAELERIYGEAVAAWKG